MGPCSPRDLAHLFFKKDEQKARFFTGYRGIPVSSLAVALHDLGLHVNVVTTATLSPGDRLIFKGNNIEMRVVAQRARARDRAVSFFSVERNLILTELLELNSDVIHAHWTYEFALAALKAQKLALITGHDAPVSVFKYIHDPYRFFRLLLALTVRLKMRNFSAVSPYLASKWKREMLWGRSIAIIPNISPFSKLAEKEHRAEAFKVLSIGDSGKLKNLHALIKAWPEVLKTIPNAELEIVGNGLEKGGAYANWARKFCLSDSITWHGYLEREKLEKLLEDSAILVHPSLEESFGLSLLEAMSHGIPAIANVKAGGPSYVLGETGILIDFKSHTKVAATITSLLLDKSLRKKLGLLAQKRATDVFSPEKVAKIYVQEYLRIIQGEKD